MADKPRGRDFIEYKSDFNMAVMDLQRIDIILTRADECSLLCGEGRLNYIIHYFSALRAFYRYLRPLMLGKYRDNFDYFFEILWTNIYSKKELTWQTFRMLEDLHNYLLRARQSLNIGMPVSVKKQIAEKWLKDEYKYT